MKKSSKNIKSKEYDTEEYINDQLEQVPANEYVQCKKKDQIEILAKSEVKTIQISVAGRNGDGLYEYISHELNPDDNSINLIMGARLDDDEFDQLNEYIYKNL